MCTKTQYKPKNVKNYANLFPSLKLFNCYLIFYPSLSILNPMNTEEITTKLKSVRNQLLALHKTLLDHQKEEFEGNNHRITSPSQYFELVTTHREFAWLKTLSELIVSVDTLLDGKDFDSENALNMLAYTKKLISSEQPHNDFAEKYIRSLHQNPSVALAHAKLMQELT